ncbi:MAG: ATP-dependent Clp protease ATP-binding subunit [Planctomycetota bacterium]|nr:MAG: ATP-dependent Clp protease ATP-binding subunit [Planctomycetota bacterium]
MNLPRLSPEAERVLSTAMEESVKLNNRFLGVEHLFLGLARERSGELAPAFAGGLPELTHFVETLRARVRGAGGMAPDQEIVLTPRGREIFQLAARIAGRTGQAHVEPAHLIEAIFSEGRSVPLRLLRALGLDVAEMHEALRPAEPEAAPEQKTSLLEKFGRDLTALARRGQLAPVIGRQREIELVAQVLLRKNKNNPVLVGEPGVGKTAVVEGCAQQIASPQCPEILRGKRIIELSLGSLVAGTKYRGEFEERLLDIIKEVRDHDDVILFLDEIHTLVGAGATGSGDALDAANIFKPALARAELRCIGATTIEEYRRYIERDQALERRFEKILVEEPSPGETVEILARLRPSLEAHHGVTIVPEALRAAVDLTVQHVHDRRLPDKALDAVDQSCARKRLQRYLEPARSAAARGGPIQVLAEDIATTVSQWTGIPLERMDGEAAKSLLNIEEALRARVVGQDQAVRAVARTILTAKAGLADPNRPLGVFFFLGPTGVGKTFLARTLAQVVFGDQKRMVRIDMSEYMEPHAISNLIGAPPGYIGHEREGILIAALRTHPHCVVLFDEVEKAHPKVFDLFLQIFDEGRLTGTHGKTADFTQAIVILTSNLPHAPEAAGGPVGFDTGQSEAPPPDPRHVLLQHLRPELVNRIDEVVVFNSLDQAGLRRIVDQYVHGIEQLLEARKLRLKLDESVYSHLLELANSREFGARELRRVVDHQLRQPLAREVLRLGEDIGVIRVSLRDGALAFESAKGREMPA